MRGRILAMAMVLVLSVWVPGVSAAIDGSGPVLCALISPLECGTEEGCQPTTLETLDLPTFIRVDFASNTISGTRSGEEKTVPVQHLARKDGAIFLQGVQQRAWSIVINEETGKMSLTASGGREAFVIFGACTAFP